MAKNQNPAVEQSQNNPNAQKPVRQKHRLVDFACFIALIIAAIILLIDNILPLIKVTVKPGVRNTLEIIQQIAVLIGVASGAYKFSRHTNKLFKLAYFIAIVIYLVAIFLALFER